MQGDVDLRRNNNNVSQIVKVVYLVLKTLLFLAHWHRTLSNFCWNADHGCHAAIHGDGEPNWLTAGTFIAHSTAAVAVTGEGRHWLMDRCLSWRILSDSPTYQRCPAICRISSTNADGRQNQGIIFIFGNRQAGLNNGAASAPPTATPAPPIAMERESKELKGTASATELLTNSAAVAANL
jgi:hypothetical protein